MLKRIDNSLVAEHVLAPKKTKGKICEVFELSDGSLGTASQLAIVAKTTRQSIYNRLKVSNDVDFVTEVNVPFKDKIITLKDGTQGTLSLWSKEHGIHIETLYTRIKSDMHPKLIFSPSKSYLLDDGFIGTVNDFCTITGHDNSTISKRLKLSKDPLKILLPKATQNRTIHHLVNGETGYAPYLTFKEDVSLKVIQNRIAQCKHIVAV
jgi:hypothetical protein